MFACVWTFGSYVEESQLMNVLVETFVPPNDRKRMEMVQGKLCNDKMGDIINKASTWLKEGKIQSLFDLVPIP